MNHSVGAHSGRGHGEIFQVGRTYKLRKMEDGREVVYWDCRALTVEISVVIFDHAGIRDFIVNVSSPAFISAEPTATQ